MTTTSDLPGLDTIREALNASDRGPLKAKDLARVLEVPPRLYRPFRERLRALEASGDLYRNRTQRYAVPSEIHLVVGKLQVVRSGDAFLKPEETGQQDIYVSQKDLDSAMDGDRVAVRIEGRPAGRNPVGRVVKIFDRARPTVVGRFQANQKFGFVSPLDRRIGSDILVPEGAQGNATNGDIVVVRIQQFGDAKRNAVGEVESILGPMDAPGVDVLAILHGHGLPADFPAEVEEAARDAAELTREPGDREDLRDLLIFTIDPATARDHDDALSLEHRDDGTVEVGIHIADVSHFVTEGSPVDLEALQRGTSVYLVDQVVPMLPHLLSSDLCSLREGEDRFALSLLVRMAPDGSVRSHRYSRSLIRCRHGLNYEQVHGILSGSESVSAEVDGVVRELDAMARVLRERRSARGSLDFDLPEARVVLDAEGAPVDIQRVVQLDSHRLVEDFMLLANELVARDAVKKKLAIPYRIHEPPPQEKVEDLRAFLGPMGYSIGKKTVKPRYLQSVINAVRGRPEEHLVSTVVLRSMSRARYAPANEGHFGLASEAYLHFTSPIRRYPDLVVHRVMKQLFVDGKKLPERWTKAMEEVCERASERERVAQQAERDSIEMKKIEFMRRHLGEDFEGTIAGVTSFGLFVLLDRVFVEGLIHVSTLGDDYYSFLPEAYALVGERNGRRFRIGDRVEVRVARADKEERQIDFLLLEGGSPTTGRGKGSGGGGRGGRGGGKSGGGSKGKGGRSKGKGGGGSGGGDPSSGGRKRGKRS
ncbi:MAG: ribonuclease R [Gemmatimonadales bacterium]|nr:MAG: ribonuclease R [Gemmatimonadales bacterium]